ncbi:type II 3-dehydroquinate dehydratase [Pontimonas sp.]|jgi:3-dehydroquinate dehydratase-2|uniref:type II 3-dehydroquinate dehydratase n=1 Tax=Pontimonas sp. TaxID=2304492 RepID=UPI002870809A|nr:type II 3-dehydroquinate dehydratase [Pontimonas sp.]MDR9396458.1 type II 3-dehydroquinate dehydratase [Pontimonas sp.]MDR9434008.1 type II 3-dehydroquinate dehydratase [Pontimonas sp.]
MQSIWVINGPNLGRLGSRQPDIYGSDTGDDIHASLQAGQPDWDIVWKQSDAEAEIIAWLHQAIDQSVPVVLNPAAFSHYSYALRDACAMVTEAGLPLIEVHLSNPAAREEFRAHSVISAVATGVIQGFGADSYRLAIAQITRA